MFHALETEVHSEVATARFTVEDLNVTALVVA
jgi:hypothetical protein